MVMRAGVMVGLLMMAGASCGEASQGAGPSQTTAPTSGMPNCVEPVDQPVNCVVQSPGLLPSFTVRYELDSASGEPVGITLTAVDASQVIEEEVTRTPAVPTFRDLNTDGVPELLVPKGLANVNTGWAVWARNETQPHLVKAGEVSASQFAMSQLGEVIAISRNDAASWTATFYNLDHGTLTAIASATKQLDTGTCSVLQHQPLQLTQAGLDARFCGDPAVLAIS